LSSDKEPKLPRNPEEVTASPPKIVPSKWDSFTSLPDESRGRSPTEKAAIIAPPSAGKTLLMVYLILKALRDFPDWCKNIYTYIHIYKGDPWNDENQLPDRCDGTCGECQAGKLEKGHKFRHPAIIPIETWDMIARARNGVIGLDEVASWLSSDDPILTPEEKEIVKNFAKFDLSVYLTDQYTFAVKKKLRAVVGQVFVPKLNVALKTDGTWDLDNHFVKNNIFDEKQNCLQYLVFNTYNDPDWKRPYIFAQQQTGVSSGDQAPVIPDKVVTCEIPPSIIAQFYSSPQPVRLAYSPEITETEADKEADNLAKEIFEPEGHYPYLKRFFTNSMSIQDAKQRLAVTDWNSTHGYSPTAIAKILVKFFNKLPDYLRQFPAGETKITKFEKKPCPACGLELTGVAPVETSQQWIAHYGSKSCRRMQEKRISEKMRKVLENGVNNHGS